MYGEYTKYWRGAIWGDPDRVPRSLSRSNISFRTLVSFGLSGLSGLSRVCSGGEFGLNWSKVVSIGLKLFQSDRMLYDCGLFL